MRTTYTIPCIIIDHEYLLLLPKHPSISSKLTTSQLYRCCPKEKHFSPYQLNILLTLLTVCAMGGITPKKFVFIDTIKSLRSNFIGEKGAINFRYKFRYKVFLSFTGF